MKYRAEIDGLRALVVVPVILFHAGFELFGGGFVGVDVFFVISGYLITSILIEEIENKRFSFVSFYERRARRILPALFFVMLCSIPFAWMWMLPSQLKSFSKSIVYVSVFISNILFKRESGYFAAAAEEKPLLHTWSLAVEEQYYLLFPIFLFFAWRFGKNRVFWMIVAFAAMSLALSEWGWRHDATANFFLAPARVWELFAGAIAAFVVLKRGVQSNNAISLVGLCAILFAIFAYDKSTPFPSVYALVPVIGVVLLILYADKKTLAAKILGTKIFVGIGLVSYSAYLWHQPLFAFARLREEAVPSSALMLALSILSIGLAFLSWQFVERPFRNRQSKTFTRKNIFIFTSVGMLAFIAIGMTGRINNGFPQRFGPEESKIMAAGINVFESQVSACWHEIGKSPKLNAACKIGAETGPVEFALIGDSHAGALSHTLDIAAKDQGLRGINASFRSCPPLLFAYPDPSNDVTNQTCAALRSDILARIDDPDLPSVIVVSARWALLTERTRYLNDGGKQEYGTDWVWKFDADRGSYKENMKHEIIKSLKLFLAHGKTLILVYPIAEMGWSVPELLAKKLMIEGELDAAAGSVSFEHFQERNRFAYDVLDSLGEQSNVIRVYPEKMNCNAAVPGRCVAHNKGVPLYFDDDHLSTAGAMPVSVEIVKAMMNGPLRHHNNGAPK